MTIETTTDGLTIPQAVDRALAFGRRLTGGAYTAADLSKNYRKAETQFRHIAARAEASPRGKSAGFTAEEANNRANFQKLLAEEAERRA